MNGVQFKIAQTDPVTFQLSESEGADDWRVIGNFSSSSAAVDAMNTLIARAKFIAPEPTFYDENGVLTIQPVLP